MEKMTPKEEELMELFWQNGPMFVKDLLDLLPEPKPHTNTVSTMVRSLEAKGYVSHKAYGNTYQYFAAIDKDSFSKTTLKGVISKYFGNSFKSAVSALVSEEKLSIDELKDLIRQVEESK